MNKGLLIGGLVVVAAIIVGLVVLLNMQTPAPATTSLGVTPTVPINTSTPAPTLNGTNTSPATVNIGIQNFAFSPKTVTVNVGDTVTWTNQDTTPHQPTSDIFQSGSLSTGQSFSYTFTTPGTYNYFCNIHPDMTGTIIVQ